MFTAKVQAADRKRYADSGVKGVVAKPFDPVKLGSQIAAILGWSM
jgi:CheY-like chemotaxis protein